MSTRVESESYNPLAEFFEQENQEDESRRGGRAVSRYRRGFKSAKRPGKFRPRRVFRRQFFRPFSQPCPWPFPFPPVADPQGAAVGPISQPAPDANDPGAGGDMDQATDAQQTSSDQEFGAYERESGRTITLPPIVICGGEPFASLDNFTFGKSTLRKDATRNHPAQIDVIARAIKKRALRLRPVPTVCIVGRTDVVGAQNFNYKLGLDRARSVKAALCKALGSYADNMTFAVSSLGEMDQTPTGNTPAARGRNRRVDVHLLSERTDGERCGTGGGRRPYGFPVASR